jgi:uncharacterized protein involved in exopolysaccharide biosynthesis
MQSLSGNATPGNAIAAHPIAVPETSSLRPFVEAAFRHRRLWVLVVVCVVVVSALYTGLMPRQYQSDMEILVQNTRGEDQITPQRTMGTVMVNGVTEEQINSEIELLRSRSLANVVVDPQWDEKSVTTRPPDQLKAHDKAVAQFSKHLSVEMVRKSNVIHVSYTASDPRSATQTLDRLLNAFLTKQREVAQPPGTTQFFASEAARYKNELDQAQQALAEYQQQHQIVSLGDTEEAKDRQINDAQTEMRDIDAKIGEESQRIGTEVGQLRSIPNRQATQERTLPNDYSVERLNTMLAELENKRTTLLTKFTPGDRLIEEVDRQIADTKSALSNARQMTSQERSTDVNPVWQAVTGSIIQNQSERQALKARRGVLEQQIGSLKGSLANTEGSTVAFTTLRQKVADLDSNYQLYTQKSNEAKMEDAMNENRLLNVAVAQNPTFAMTPFRPKPVLDLTLGGFTALFLASFLVFFAEMGRSTIATPREFSQLTRYPLLATNPLVRMRRPRPSERLSESSSISIIVPPRKDSEGNNDSYLGQSANRKEARAS